MDFRKWMVAIAALAVLALAGCGDRDTKSVDPRNAGGDTMSTESEGSESGAAPSAPETQQGTGPQGQVTDTLWVMESRGTKQCEGGGLTVEQSRGKLADGGIQVVESRCGVRTDRMYPSVCGGATGDILLHRIPTAMLDAALELGFDPVGNVAYQFSSCAPKQGSGSGASDI
ncbi:hypothetical protein ACONUD_07825 [Microbulbifer harenosus]|uniref:Lipoprotein n=1 Tax=Microbulbifer harenosus TaxID=2576840 RepID=A0ABY2UFY8_9GAMM|nr:hypothetical protein [Microbulbifer harenosus]TLM76248.1 hypothetical protein FDY93_14940 [Microbulbifer harenosus]